MSVAHQPLPPIIGQIVGQRAFSSSSLSPRQSLQDKKADLDPPSLHRKIPFPTRISETGSMTGWWVLSPARFRPDVRPCKATSGRCFPLAHSETEFNGIGGLLTYIGDGPHLSNRRR